MQFKPLTAIAVLLLVVASLLVAGCTTSTTTNTNQTPSATTSTATHDALLEKYIAADKNDSSSVGNVTVWEVTWTNGTSAHVDFIIKAQTATVTGNETFIAFPTTQDATQYLNAMNKTGYNLTSAEFSGSGGPYQNSTGHAPQVYKYYSMSEGQTLHGIRQEDNIITVSKGTK
jgi:hypothetical protein